MTAIDAHPAPETLLLLALGSDLGGAARALEDHAAACASCGAALDRLLEARFHEEEAPAAAPGEGPAAFTREGREGISFSREEERRRDLPAAPAEAGDARLSSSARLGRALRAAAADARTFDAPAPPALLGTAWLAGGDAVSVFRRPDAPSTFALDRRDLFGRRVAIEAAGAPEVPAEVDRFGRMRLAAPDAEALARRLQAGEKVTLSPR